MIIVLLFVIAIVMLVVNALPPTRSVAGQLNWIALWSCVAIYFGPQVI